MADPKSRTTREISDINILCYTVHKLLKELKINSALQRRILGGLTEDDFRSILNNEAGTTLPDDKVKPIRIFYNNIYLMSLSVAPHAENIEDTWLNRTATPYFDDKKPLDYLIRFQYAGLNQVSYTLTSARFFILAENWGLDPFQIDNLSEKMREHLEMVLFMGKALEVLFPTPEERTLWMQKANPEFNNRAPVNVLGTGEFEDVFNVFQHLFIASNGAKTWVPRFDYKVDGDPIQKPRKQLAFRLL